MRGRVPDLPYPPPLLDQAVFDVPQESQASQKGSPLSTSF